MKVDLQLDNYFNLKGFVKSNWGGNQLIYIKDINSELFKSEIFSVSIINGVLQQLSAAIYFKKLTELSYKIFKEIKPQFGTFKEKRMVSSNIKFSTYKVIEKGFDQPNLHFKDENAMSKYEKIFMYYEDEVEPFFEKFQKIRDLDYFYSNASTLGEDDLLTLLYLSKLYNHDKLAFVIDLLDKSYKERLLNEKSDEINKSIIMESISNTEKRIEILKKL